jgi:hypothetical protein
MQTQRDYKVIMGKSLFDLITLVKECIEAGWECQGGITINGTKFYQAMVRIF